MGMASKTLSRRIDAAMVLSPFKFVLRQRLMREAHLIETTGLSIEAVAERVGTALRRPIKRGFGVTPGAMRA